MNLILNEFIIQIYEYIIIAFFTILSVKCKCGFALIFFNYVPCFMCRNLKTMSFIKFLMIEYGYLYLENVIT